MARFGERRRMTRLYSLVLRLGGYLSALKKGPHHPSLREQSPSPQVGRYEILILPHLWGRWRAAPEGGLR